MDQVEQPTGDSANPPTKRQKVDTSVTVTVGGEAFSMSPEAFGRLEGFVADKIAHSEKKTRLDRTTSDILMVSNYEIETQ